MSDEEAKEQAPALDPIEFGFDTNGYLKIKIHLSMGMWNMLGALAEAQTRVMAQFGRMAQEEEKQKKGLIRPNGNLENFKNKWH